MRCAMFAGLLALMSGAAFAQTRGSIPSTRISAGWDRTTRSSWSATTIPASRIYPATCREPRQAGSKAASGLCRGSEPLLDRLPREWARFLLPSSMPKTEIIGFSQASLFFKTFQIHRSLDPEKHVRVYTVVSTKLINGSPFNSISVVPTDVR